jgi:hypothetical protein
MELFPPDLDKTLHGMPEDLRFDDGSPVYNQDGVDLSHIRSCLAETPVERLQCIQALARISPRKDGTPLFNPLEILRALAKHGVDFILVGSLAEAVQGSPYPAVDVDVVYSGEHANTGCLREALKELCPPHPYYKDGDKHKELMTTYPLFPRQFVTTKYGQLDAFGADDLTDLEGAAESIALEPGLCVRTLSLEECVRRRERRDLDKDRAALHTLRATVQEKRKLQQEKMLRLLAN